MHFFVLTLFPEMVLEGLSYSVIGRAIKRGIISINVLNIRDFTLDRHLKTDDYPFGGGPGMVMQVQPVLDCYRAAIAISGTRQRSLIMSPAGRAFNQEMALELSKEENIIIICGHYEGIDERVIELTGGEEVSLGDFVVTGGEMPAMCLIDAVSRLIPGVLGGEGSALEESFSGGLLEYPQYSRPEVYEGMRVPEVLLSGDHEKVKRWRRERSLERTYQRRPELLERAELSVRDKEFLESLDLGDSLC